MLGRSPFSGGRRPSKCIRELLRRPDPSASLCFLLIGIVCSAHHISVPSEIAILAAKTAIKLFVPIKTSLYGSAKIPGDWPCYEPFRIMGCPNETTPSLFIKVKT